MTGCGGEAQPELRLLLLPLRRGRPERGGCGAGAGMIPLRPLGPAASGCCCCCSSDISLGMSCSRRRDVQEPQVSTRSCQHQICCSLRRACVRTSRPSGRWGPSNPSGVQGDQRGCRRASIAANTPTPSLAWSLRALRVSLSGLELRSGLPVSLPDLLLVLTKVRAAGFKRFTAWESQDCVLATHILLVMCAWAVCVQRREACVFF